MSVASPPQRRIRRTHPLTTSILLPIALLMVQAESLNAQTVLVRESEFRPLELRVSAFELERPGPVQIEAVGAAPGSLQRFARARNAFVRFMREVFNRSVDLSDERNGWPADAWIVDARTREVVWQLGAGGAEEGLDGLRRFDGAVELPAGTYEVYYSVFASGWDGDASRRFARDVGRELTLVVEGRGRAVDAATARRSRDAFRESAIVSLAGVRRDGVQRAGFVLDRPADVELYALGEANAGEAFDYGWILNADTRERVWELSYADSRHAGGAWRNRVGCVKVPPPAGRYVAYYVTDDSHAPDDWDAAPPADPDFWGLTLRVADADARAAIRTFDYDPAPAADAIVALTRIRHDEHRSAAFTVTRPTGVRIFALGEGERGGMFDYAWIVNAHTRAPVWTMTYDITEHAGGTDKNRLYDGTIRLEPGSYVVSYTSDDSHAFGDWNAGPPIDRDYWGITVLPITGAPDPDVVRPYDPRNDPAIVAQIVGVRNGSKHRRRFSLAQDAGVRVYALGEGDESSMYDRAWIVDADGQTVWRLSYDETSHAGGARKNRLFNDVVQLPAGAYELIYQTDDSHAFGSWNSDPPHDFASWGVTLFRTDAR
jgi:hypothetical protein